MSPELEKLIKETILCIEGLTYLDDTMLDETKQDNPICKIYGLAHGLLSNLGIGCDSQCPHFRFLGTALKEYKKVLKSAKIMDVEKIVQNSSDGVPRHAF